MTTEAFEDFLKHFKSSNTEEAARDALSNLNMDDEEEMDLESTPRGLRSGRRAGGQRQQAPTEKVKYMTQLQEVANRERDAITIDLEDLKQVRMRSHAP